MVIPVRALFLPTGHTSCRCSRLMANSSDSFPEERGAELSGTRTLTRDTLGVANLQIKKEK